MKPKNNLPFRLGTTSYIWPDDILPNVVQLAPLVDDIELVLFESDEYGSNLPGKDVIAELRRLAQARDLTYTVHLPLDLRLVGDPLQGSDQDAARQPSLEKARHVIERTRPLEPFAYVVHLDGRAIQNTPPPPGPPLARRRATGEGQSDAAMLACWQSQAARSLEQVADWAGDARKVCVENLENYDPAAFAPVIEEVLVSRCVDVGHFWRQGRDPLPHLRQWQARTRVVHIHGVAERDHKSLAEMPPEALDPAVKHLLENMRGVVTMEVFGVDDFFSSKQAFEAAVVRLSANPANQREFEKQNWRGFA
jgi:sugar phosphate isomerase/epimerase